DVESTHAASASARPAAHHDRHGAASTTAKAATTAHDLYVRRSAIKVDGAAAASLARQLIAQFGDAILHLAGIKHVLLASSLGPGDRNRFVISIRRQPGVGQTGAAQGSR